MVHTLANGEKICCVYVGLCALSQDVSSNILCSSIVTSFMLRITLIRNDESVALKILREECIIKSLCMIPLNLSYFSYITEQVGVVVILHS